MVKRKSFRNVTMKYFYSITSFSNVIFLVTELNSETDFRFTWTDIELTGCDFLDKKHRFKLSQKKSILRIIKWMKENYPEFLI